MVNYSNGKIYRLVDNTNNTVYYGSTCQKIRERKQQHIKDYKGYLNNTRKYRKSYDIIKNNDYKMELVELFPCNSKIELLKREQYYITNNNCINENIPARTSKEWYQDNKKKQKIKSKKWYEENKERKLKLQKLRYEKLKKEMFTCKCGEYISKYTFTYGNAAKHKKCEK
jgi:hypothetical protein